VCYSLVNISILQSMLIPMSDTRRKLTHDKQNFQMNYFFKFPSSTTKHSPLITLKSTSESKLLSAVTLFALYQRVSATALAFKQTDPFIRVSEADADKSVCVMCSRRRTFSAVLRFLHNYRTALRCMCFIELAAQLRMEIHGKWDKQDKHKWQF
jgi:hypothetical protein